MTFRVRRSQSETYIGHGRLRVCLVCLSLVAFPHHCTDPDVTRGMIGVPSSCALFGRFALGARISLLSQHSAQREMSASASIRYMPGYVSE